MTISEKELELLRAQYLREKTEYEHLSEHVMMQCQRYKKLHPKDVRVVFSRQPLVKEWDSTINKIRSKRAKGREAYGYGDIEDLIGLTVLFAYESDKAAFIKWLQKAFKVETSNKDAIRHDPSGHRALHYIVRAHAGVCVSNPAWQDKKCEIQIKTLLEEAFDAKAHDLTYKPGHLAVSDEIKLQFKHFGDVLHAVDMQSEFLKDLILTTERQISLRRAACVGLYLDFPEDLKYGAPHRLDPSIKDPTPKHLERDLATIQRLHLAGPNFRLCRLAAAYALKFGDELFAQQALLMCGPLAASAPTDPDVQITIATVEWALGDFDSSMRHLLLCIELAATPGSPISAASAKSTFVYLYADWFISQRPVVRTDWDQLAKRYAQELHASAEDDIKDSLGFYKIVFGTREDIEEGRRMVAEAHRSAAPTLRPFFQYHEHIALKRLGELLKDELGG
jgi:ppGpp synthetase/RelA/SpoT-type nucleotidyltranferase